MLIPISGLFLVSFFFSTNSFFPKKRKGTYLKKKFSVIFVNLSNLRKNRTYIPLSRKNATKKKNTLEKKTTAFDPGKKKTKLFDIKKDDELGMQEDYLENLENRKPSVINYVYFKIFRKINL